MVFSEPLRRAQQGIFVSVRRSRIRGGKHGVVIVCSRKVDKRSTRRNLLRRRIREIVRKDLGELLKGRHITIDILPAAREATYKTLKEDLLHVIHFL